MAPSSEKEKASDRISGTQIGSVPTARRADRLSDMVIYAPPKNP